MAVACIVRTEPATGAAVREALARVLSMMIDDTGGGEWFDISNGINIFEDD